MKSKDDYAWEKEIEEGVAIMIGEGVDITRMCVLVSHPMEYNMFVSVYGPVPIKVDSFLLPGTWMIKECY